MKSTIEGLLEIYRIGLTNIGNALMADDIAEAREAFSNMGESVAAWNETALAEIDATVRTLGVSLRNPQ